MEKAQVSQTYSTQDNTSHNICANSHMSKLMSDSKVTIKKTRLSHVF